MRQVPGVLLAAVCSGAVAAAPPARGLQVEWVDVEGGAATLIVTPAGESVLIDSGWEGGRDAGRIREAARHAGVDRIDHLVTTHWHRDHVGGVAALAERLPIGRFYDHGFPESLPDLAPELKEAYLRTTGGHSRVLRPGDAIELRQAPGTPPVAIRVVAAHGLVAGEAPGAPQTRPCTAEPPHPAMEDDKSDNHRSVGVVLSFGRFELLDLGDLTRNVEHKLACPKNLAGVVDVYQVTHHGLDNSNHPALLQAVAPTVAVVNNGPRKGGKPEVYRRLQAVGSVKDVFQVHRNVEAGPADNAPPPFVANDDEACQGQPVRLAVDAAARTYTVEVPSKGTRRTYEVR
ncbi:MAG TPA: MBL fold metallo-hydrolase [Vicinamibacteria bacterium]|nr:MBL fold metallo-hydrolase [Vicinamibacteria bacterium]